MPNLSPKLLLIGSGPVALYYGFVFSRQGCTVDHAATSKRRRYPAKSKLFVECDRPALKRLYRPRFVALLEFSRLEHSGLKYQNYDYILIADEAERASLLCQSLEQCISSPMIIVLTSCWDTRRCIRKQNSKVIWGYPEIVCESVGSYLKAVSLDHILIDCKALHNLPYEVLAFKALFKRIGVGVKPVDLEVVYPYLFLLTTCIYAQILSTLKICGQIDKLAHHEQFMCSCYKEAHSLLSGKMNVSVERVALQTGLPWNPHLLITSASRLFEGAKKPLSLTDWIIEQLIYCKRAKAEYFIKTLLRDHRMNSFKQLRFLLSQSLVD